MALALRFAEEAEFSSRACDSSSYDAPDASPGKAFFRWSRPVRQLLGPHANKPIKTKTLIIAMPGVAQGFIKRVTATWTPVGTLVTSDQYIPSCTLQPDIAGNAAVVLSRTELSVTDESNTLAVVVGPEVPIITTWVWLNTLLQHVDTNDIVCLCSELSTIYADRHLDAENGAKLRVLTSSTVPQAMKINVSLLEVPQFVTGIPAALLTYGELRKHHVRVFVSLRDVSSTSSDVMRSFMPIAVSMLGTREDGSINFELGGFYNDRTSTYNVLYT
ncbi:hypothetical protein CCR75_004538 [Bremia lactucae]|uniref:Proteasome assembly chaperone 1 n=1 Tax=Bremia lactucae TaxID=4779 RepID=A0A976FIA8_BRELC|nr:hypothetical protein CCR75_004531 [Bremia lactucae]TDH66979.1 hypothetical protein CCR75_004538 [Bremia lactucae]